MHTRLRATGLIVVLVGALLLTGCGAVEGKLIPYDSIGQHVRQAAAMLAAAPGVRISGTVRDNRSETLTVDLRITGGGDAVGTISRNGATGALLTIDGQSYVDAPAAWWRSDSRAAAYNQSWVRVPVATVGFDIAAQLRPAVLGAAVLDGFGGVPIDTPEMRTMDGVRAQRIESGGSELWISAARPYRIVRLTGTEVTGDNRAADLAITPATSDEAVATGKDVALALPALKDGSYDAQLGVRFMGALTNSCDAQGCTVTGRLTNASAVTGITAVLHGNVTGGGTTLGTCRSPRTPVKAGATAPISCRVVSPAWTAFYHRATAPGSSSRTTSYQVGANASTIAPPPAALGCLATKPGGKACPPATASDGALRSTYRQSGAAWFGGRGADQSNGKGRLDSWRTMINASARSADRLPWSGAGRRTVAAISDVDGRPFVAQFDRRTGALVTAAGLPAAEVAAMRQVLAKVRR